MRNEDGSGSGDRTDGPGAVLSALSVMWSDREDQHHDQRRIDVLEHETVGGLIMENAKEYLQQYHEACLRAERIRHEYERESELIDSIRSPQGLDGLSHGQSFGSQVEAKVMKLVAKLEELKDAEIEALQIRREIFDTIKELPGLMSEVLFERYINFKTWDDVATSCFISKRKAFMIHNEALEKLCNK